MPITEIISAIVGFISGMIVLYLTAYSKAKGQNKALREDLSILEDEKQKIAAKYMAEAEELKKKHALDIEKRKYQYEDKRAQFVKYFALIDEFHGKSNDIFSEQFPPIMNKFLSSYLIDDEATKQNAIVDFNAEVQEIFNMLYKEQLRITTETNSIRLISSETMDHLLDSLETAVKEATDAAVEMLKFMATPGFWEDQSRLGPYQERATKYGQNVKIHHDELRNRMKIELNEI